MGDRQEGSGSWLQPSPPSADAGIWKSEVSGQEISEFQINKNLNWIPNPTPGGSKSAGLEHVSLILSEELPMDGGLKHQREDNLL